MLKYPEINIFAYRKTLDCGFAVIMGLASICFRSEKLIVLKNNGITTMLSRYSCKKIELNRRSLLIPCCIAIEIERSRLNTVQLQGQ